MIPFHPRHGRGLLLLTLAGVCLAGCGVITFADYGETEGGLTGTYCSGPDEDAYTVVWYSTEGVDGQGTYGATLSPAGRFRVAPRRLVDSTVVRDSFSSASPIRLSYDEAQGHSLLAWTAFGTAPGEDTMVTTAVVYPDGGSETPVPLAPGLMVDTVYNSRTDEYLAAVDPRDEGPVMGYRVSAQGEPLGQPFPLSRGGTQDALACLVFNPDANEYLAVSVTGEDSEPSDPSREIYARPFGADGSPLGDWVTVLLFSGISLWDWELEDDVLAAYLPLGGNYVIFVQLTHRVGDGRLQETWGQRVSASAQLLGDPFVANTDPTGLASFASPRPALAVSPLTHEGSLVYCFMHGLLCGQPLSPTGIPERAPSPLGLAYLVDGQPDYMPVTDPLVVVPNAAGPAGLVLWTRFLPPFWEWAAFGMRVNLP